MNVIETRLKGLHIIELDLFDDERGSFREAWQAANMQALGLPAFQPVQQNVSESKRGVIRGIHAEPWEKYIHVVYGEVFAALVDLREESQTFGQVETITLDRSQALFVSKGFGNSFQITSDFGVYSYLVTDHWQAGLTYPAIAFDDPDLAIDWPIKEGQIVSEKDQHNPTMRQYYPHKFNE